MRNEIVFASAASSHPDDMRCSLKRLMSTVIIQIILIKYRRYRYIFHDWNTNEMYTVNHLHFLNVFKSLQKCNERCFLLTSSCIGLYSSKLVTLLPQWRRVRNLNSECNDPAPAFGRFPVKSQAGCLASE